MKENKRYDAASIAILLSLIVLDLFVWQDIFLYDRVARSSQLYFLDIGKGDAALMIFPDNIKVLTDAGPDQTIVSALEKILPPDDTYIDLGIISDAQAGHFVGYEYLLDHYRFGAIIYNGRTAMTDIKDWSALFEKISQKNIPLITVGAGDVIFENGHEIDILSPNKAFAKSAAAEDTAIVELIKTESFKALLTADSRVNVKDALLAGRYDLRADIIDSSGSAYLTDPGAEFMISSAPTATLEASIHNGKLEIVLYNKST